MPRWSLKTDRVFYITWCICTGHLLFSCYLRLRPEMISRIELHINFISLPEASGGLTPDRYFRDFSSNSVLAVNELARGRASALLRLVPEDHKSGAGRWLVSRSRTLSLCGFMFLLVLNFKELREYACRHTSELWVSLDSSSNSWHTEICRCWSSIRHQWKYTYTNIWLNSIVNILLR